MVDPARRVATLIDFGFALVQKTKGGRLEVHCGSDEYNAPEMLEMRSAAGKDAGKGYHGPAVDAWALGVLTYAALCAAFPFGAARSRILQGRYAKGALEATASAAACSFVDGLLVVDPNSEMKLNRMSCAGACKH
eukprot:2634682-Prymnesium_polylepis.1